MFKKKFAICVLFAIMAMSLSACGKTNINLIEFVIEKRENLFTANDNLYSVSFSTGSREKDYNFDGVVGEMVPFGILTLTRNENLPLANDTYSYIVTINDIKYSGFLKK